jgi:hypothetical protein
MLETAGRTRLPSDESQDEPDWNTHRGNIMLRRVQLVSFVISSLFLCSWSIGAQQAPPKIDVNKLGPQVGERVPEFSLQDQFGKTWTRDSLMGTGGLMLVFYRSADW